MSEGERTTAALHLREARRLSGEAALEEVSWARCACPSSIPAIRLEARLALELGDLDTADALIAQGLLLARNDHGLRRLMAARLADRGQRVRARTVISQLLKERPHHVGVRLLAAELARRENDHDTAADLLWNIVMSRPDQSRPALDALFEQYLDMDDLEHAEAVLLRFRPPDPIRTAQLLDRLRRPVEAADVLQRALEHGEGDTDACLAAYIRQLEACDDRTRLLAAIDRVLASQPRASLAASAALLSIGEFELASALIEPHLEQGPYRRESLLTLTVINWSADRVDEAADDLSAANGVGGISRRAMADLWRRAVQGRMIARLRRGFDADEDHRGEPLRSMLRSALRSFESNRRPRSRTDDEEAATHASICTMALESMQ